MTTNNPDNETLVAEFCESEFAAKSRCFLIQHAAQVVYIARMARSTRLTAAFLSVKFKRKFSRRPIEDILNKVKIKQIVVTPEQLAAAARQQPKAKHFAEMFPEALYPGSKTKIEDAPTPAEKKAAAKKKQIEENTPQTPIRPTIVACDRVNKPHAKHMSPEGIQAAMALLDAADQEDEEFHK